jgi:hypothetical protein
MLNKHRSIWRGRVAHRRSDNKEIEMPFPRSGISILFNSILPLPNESKQLGYGTTLGYGRLLTQQDPTMLGV